MHGEFDMEIDHKRRTCLQIVDDIIYKMYGYNNGDASKL
jgi:hypothetical protein